jgi:hypothetical protein
VLAQRLFDDLPPGFLPLVVLTLLVSLSSNHGPELDLDERLPTLTPGVADFAMLRELPESVRQDAFTRLPPDRRDGIVVELRKRAARR